MDHFFPTRWGGRQHRYVRFPGAVGRCHDPYDGSHPVEFAQPIEYEGWLRWRFDPNTARITHRAQQLTAWSGRKNVAATPTFVVTGRDGRVAYHLVVAASPRKRLSELRALAAHTGAKVVVTVGAELRRDVELFWRLEFLRSASQLHAGDGDSLDASILQAVRSGCNSRSGLQALLCEDDPQLVDARLGHLHCSGVLTLELDRNDFGVVLAQEVIT